MSHPDEGVLQAVLDGELATADEALGAPGALEAHLASCEACRTRLEEMRATMMEADGLVARLDDRTAGGQGSAARHPGTTARRLGRRFRVSMGQLGIAAGLLVTVTAGLLVNFYPRDRVARFEDATSAGRRDAAPAERSLGDTFRLRAGGFEEAKGGQEEVKAAREVDAPGAPRPLRKAAASQEKDAEGTPPGATDDAPLAPEPQALANAVGDVAGRQAAPPPAAAAAPAPQKIEGDYLPAARPRPLESAIARPRVLGTLVPIRIDTLAGTFRSSYRLGDQVVVLEEGVRPVPAVEQERDEVAGLAAKAATSEYRWELRGTPLRLSGPVSRDSLIALSALVR